MEKDKNIEVIETIFQKNKPKGVDTLMLKIEPTSGKYEYYVSPQYIIDKDDGFDLMKIIWKNDDKTNWETKGDRIFQKFEQDTVKMIKRYTGLDIYVRGRGVTEKNYWLSQQPNNTFPNF